MNEIMNKRSVIMKRNHFLLAPLALGLALGSFQFTPTLKAQSQSQADPQQDQQARQPAALRQQQLPGKRVQHVG